VSDGVELVGGEAKEIVFGETTGAEQAGEDLGQDGVAVVEGAVDPAALLTEPAFQFPEFRGFPDPGGAFLGFPAPQAGVPTDRSSSVGWEAVQSSHPCNSLPAPTSRTVF